jgi:hypothetical protein
MPPFRIPFTSRKGPVTNGTEVTDENARPGSRDVKASNSPYSSKPSLALGKKESQDEPNEFQLSCTLLLFLRPTPLQVTD